VVRRRRLDDTCARYPLRGSVRVVVGGLIGSTDETSPVVPVSGCPDDKRADGESLGTRNPDAETRRVDFLQRTRTERTRQDRKRRAIVLLADGFFPEKITVIVIDGGGGPKRTSRGARVPEFRRERGPRVCLRRTRTSVSPPARPTNVRYVRIPESRRARYAPPTR